MHRLMLVCLALLISISALAAVVPGQINYQGFLTAPDGSPLDTLVNMTFNIYQNSAGGLTLWSETHNSVQVTNGLFDVHLGETLPLSSNNFWRDSLWLGVTVGSNSEMTPRTRFVSVPYAYRVGTVDGATGGAITGDVVIGGKACVGPGSSNAGTGAFAVGLNNSANGNNASVTGGMFNTAGGYLSFIGGGDDHEVNNQRGVICGGYNNTVSGDVSVIAGGESNSITAGASFIGGGGNNAVTQQYTFVGGGRHNRAQGQFAVVAGGGGLTQADSNSASGNYSAIVGGRMNNASGLASFVGGGQHSRARGDYSVVAGGGGPMQYDSNSAIGYGSAIGGGRRNRAVGVFATVSGGSECQASEGSSTVGGGYMNTASGLSAAICGGGYNHARGEYSVVAGGGGTWVSDSNSAVGDYSMIPGGRSNCAGGDYSFAAGRRAKANHGGAFVWGDSYDGDVTSDSANSFTVRASGGIQMYTNTALSAGVRVYAGASAWVSVSDSTKKRNIRLVDTRDILDRVSRLPIKQWSYKAQDPSVEHVGPMAQDFWNQFHLGDDSLSISTLDPDGIALAAIQELHHQNQELQKELTALRARLQTLEAAQQQSLNERSNHE